MLRFFFVLYAFVAAYADGRFIWTAYPFPYSLGSSVFFGEIPYQKNWSI